MALANDWVRTIDRLADAQFKDAVAALSAWMMEAYDRQAAELKQQKRVEDCQKQVGGGVLDLALGSAAQQQVSTCCLQLFVGSGWFVLCCLRLALRSLQRD